MAIPKFVSDQWIQERFLQTKRVVLKNSSDFFFNTLRPAFELIKTFPLKNRVFIWSKNAREPMLTTLQAQHFIENFFKLQNLSGEVIPLTEGLKYKKEFLCRFYRENGFVFAE